MTDEQTAQTAKKTTTRTRTTRRPAKRGLSDVSTTELSDLLEAGPVKLASVLTPRLRGRYRYCPEMKAWLGHDGGKWVRGVDDEVLRETVEVVKQWAVATVQEEGLTKDVASRIGTFSGGTCQTHAIKIARTQPGILTRLDEFDAPADVSDGKPYLLHCANGWTVEMYADGSTKPRRTTADDLNTRTACAYDPKATAPLTAYWWKQYQPDDEVRRFQLQMFATGLSGMGSETFTAWFGELGGNGKSTIQTLMHAVGGGYSMLLPVDVILARTRSPRETFRNELADLRGARLVFTSEPQEGERFNLGIIKDITGGSEIDGRANYSKAETFIPRVLLTLCSNNRPMWSNDGGMERRYREIEWPYRVPGATARASFKDELKAEAPGVLNVVLANWQGTHPVPVPEAVVKQTEAAKLAADPFAQFAKEALSREDGAKTRGKDMYAAYAEWCRQNGQRPLSSTRLGTALVRLGFEKGTSNGVRYLDVTVIEEYRPAVYGL